MKPLSWRKKQWTVLRAVLMDLYPNRRTELNYTQDYELLFATILSAQCTDDRVNTVSAVLFDRFKHLQDYCDAEIAEIERIVYSTGFYRAKARHVQESARQIAERFGGKLPSTMQELITLPGVARKTANVVLQNCFDVLDGIAVDTHIIRFANRFGLSISKNPDHIEQDLMVVIDKSEWMIAGYWIKEYGRQHGRPVGPAYNATTDPLVSYIVIHS